MRMQRTSWAVMGLALLATQAGCSQSPSLPPATFTAHISPADRVVLARFLPGLAKAHRDKTQLSFLARFKGLSAPVAKFNVSMARRQGRLLRQLQTWARKHHFSLQYHYPKSVRGAALRVQTNIEGHLLLTAGEPKFQRMYLVLMYADFSSQVSMDMAMMKYATDRGLRSYLVQALAVNRTSLQQISSLLKRYRWASAKAVAAGDSARR